MANVTPTLQNLVTDTWVKAAWEEFVVLADDPKYEKFSFYYDQGYMRIEPMSVGSSHSQDNAIISKVVSLYATVKNIRVKELINCSFRKAEIGEFQPDLAFYIGSDFRFPPRTNSPIDLNEFDPPTLVVETAASSLSDDLGMKRLIYEESGVREYWVEDVKQGRVIAFEILAGRSGRVRESQVLPGLAIAIVEEALKRSQTEDDGEVNRWLLQVFSQS